MRNRRHLFRPLTGYGFGPLTFAFIAISIVVFVRSRFGTDLEPIQSLFISSFLVGDGYVPPDLSLPEIRHGQVDILPPPPTIPSAPIYWSFYWRCRGQIRRSNFRMSVQVNLQTILPAPPVIRQSDTIRFLPRLRG